jgi:hypothetical protein
MKRGVLLVGIALALTGCSNSTTNPNEPTAQEQVCGENPSYMENVPECKDMSASEKEMAEAVGQNKRTKAAASEAESVLKKREAERTANAIEGTGG